MGKDNNQSKAQALAAAANALPELRFSSVRPDEPFSPPARQHESDAGYDIAVSRLTQVRPGLVCYLPTNLAVGIPDGCWGLLLPRSSLCLKKGVFMQPGTIDAGYRGELMIVVYNYTTGMVVFDRGERAAQLVIMRRPRLELAEVPAAELLQEKTTRGQGGFGSTGQK